jgi:hypothetical protein
MAPGATVGGGNSFAAATGRTGGPATGPVSVGSPMPGLGAADGPTGSARNPGSALIAPEGIMAVARRDPNGVPPSPWNAGGGDYRPGSLGHVGPYNPAPTGGGEMGGGVRLAGATTPGGRGLPDGSGGGSGYDVTPGNTGRGAGGGANWVPDGDPGGRNPRNDGPPATPTPVGPGTTNGKGPGTGLPSYGASFSARDSAEGVPSLVDISNRHGFVVVTLDYDATGRVVGKPVVFLADVPDNSLRNMAVRDAEKMRIAVGVKNGVPQSGSKKLKYIFEKGKDKARVVEYVG